MIGMLSEESFFWFLLLVSSPLLSAVTLSQSKASMWISLDVLGIIILLNSCTSSLFQGKSQLSTVVKSMRILRYCPETFPCLSLVSASFAYSFSFKSYLFGSSRCPKDSTQLMTKWLIFIIKDLLPYPGTSKNFTSFLTSQLFPTVTKNCRSSCNQEENCITKVEN